MRSVARVSLVFLSFHPLLYVTQVQMGQGPAFVPMGNVGVLYSVDICLF